MKKVLALVAASTLMATSAMADEAVMSKFNMSIGGYVKLDYAYNSDNLGSNGTITPGGAGLNIAPNSPAGQSQQSILGIRQSRLWVKVNGPDAMGAKTGGLIEGDFYGDPSAAAESPQFRARLAYGTLDWANTSILFGQYWDMFGPMVASTQDFRSGSTTGAPNTPRIPMAKLTQRLPLGDGTRLEFVVGVSDPAQLGNNSNANNIGGTPNTQTGANVNYNAQASFISKALGVAPGYFGLSNKPLTITAFGQAGDEYLAANTGSHALRTWGAGAYLFAPVLRSSDGKSRAMTMSFEGQVYEAANMSYNAATSGNTANVLPLSSNPAVLQPMKNYGAAAQIIFYPTQELGITAGYGTRIMANKGFDLSSTAIYQKSNSEAYFNVAYDLNAAVRVAAEYQNLTARYVNENSAGTALAGNKITESVNIGRLCAYYFF